MFHQTAHPRTRTQSEVAARQRLAVPAVRPGWLRMADIQNVMATA
jgi:hypothetical protein